MSTDASPWSPIATMWSNCFTSPSRISAQERECYRRWARERMKNKSPTALVLGATPEIREELFALGYKVTCVDISLDMILAMNELLTTKSTDEVLVKGNWLEVPLAENYFDIVVGDAVMPNILWEDRPKLLSRVCRFLKPNGIFLTRAFCARTQKLFHTTTEVIENAKNKTALPLMQQSIELTLELQYLTLNSSDRIGSFKKAKESLDQYLNDIPEARADKMIAEVIEHQYLFWFSKFIDKTFVYATLDDEEAVYKSYFSTQNRFEASDHNYGKLTPMYFFKKT